MELISPALRLEFREFCSGLYLRQIDDIFQMAGIPPGTIPPNRNVSGQRRTLVETYYASIDWTSLADVQKFLQVLGLVISQSYISDAGKNFIRELCSKEGLIVESHQVRLPEKALHAISDLFVRQFPVGLPFGVIKPDFAITAKEGGQSLRFELKSGIGIIWRDIYPNFDFQSFQAASGITPATNLALKQALFKRPEKTTLAGGVAVKRKRKKDKAGENNIAWRGHRKAKAEKRQKPESWLCRRQAPSPRDEMQNDCTTTKEIKDEEQS